MVAKEDSSQDLAEDRRACFLETVQSSADESFREMALHRPEEPDEILSRAPKDELSQRPEEALTQENPGESRGSSEAEHRAKRKSVRKAKLRPGAASGEAPKDEPSHEHNERRTHEKAVADRQSGVVKDAPLPESTHQNIRTSEREVTSVARDDRGGTGKKRFSSKVAFEQLSNPRARPLGGPSKPLIISTCIASTGLFRLTHGSGHLFSSNKATAFNHSSVQETHRSFLCILCAVKAAIRSCSLQVVYEVLALRHQALGQRLRPKLLRK